MGQTKGMKCELQAVNIKTKNSYKDFNGFMFAMIC